MPSLSIFIQLIDVLLHLWSNLQTSLVPWWILHYRGLFYVCFHSSMRTLFSWYCRVTKDAKKKTSLTVLPIQLARDIMKEMKLMREIRHTNVNNFIGAMVDQDNIKLVTEFCSKGALFDLLNNPDVKLDLMFVASLISDLGAKYLWYFSPFQFLNDNIFNYRISLK